MPHQLTLDLSDPLFEAVRQAAERSGKSPEQWIQDRLQTQLAVPPEKGVALARLMRFSGAADLGHPTDMTNEQIDADLAREYGATHEDQD